MGLFGNNGIDFIIAGLGNPGSQYENTRHNAGFLFIDRAAEKLGFKVNKLKHYALTAKENVGGLKLLFMKPQTYMNESGLSVSDAMRFYKLTPDKVIIVHDDISLPPGGMRIRKKGSDGGQKGMRSVISHFGTDEFVRIKIGVGSPQHTNYDVVDYVLGQISPADKKLILPVLDDTLDAIKLIINGKIEEAMNKYNKRGIGAES